MSQMVAGALDRDVAPAAVGVVRGWLLVVAGLVVVMAAIGGATRLTGSGLSITEWDVVKGVIPPLGPTEWSAVFEKYKQIPQYTRVNPGMTLAEFKTIYWWEWGHRAFGRALGLAFVGPALWFWLSGVISHRLAARLAGVLAIGGLQAFVGWFMVQSGLVDRVSVSPVRLAMHLTLAVVVLGLLLWLALGLDRKEREGASTPLAGGALLLVALTLVQIVLGAFVAGLKAGHAYNTWPLMDGRLIPNGLGTLSPWYLNLAENVTSVQFNHRMAAYLLLVAAVWHVMRARRLAPGTHVAATAHHLVAAVALQAALGVWTLLAGVPIALGLAHQLGALAVVALAVRHLDAARRG
jgi:cytochrome c oxidase assembly protein subunit 15